MRINGVTQWRIRYRYQDHRGRTYEKWSAAMSPEEAEGWKAGETAIVRFDPHSPKQSTWAGRP
jgi:hypothetical protein